MEKKFFIAEPNDNLDIVQFMSDYIVSLSLPLDVTDFARTYSGYYKPTLLPKEIRKLFVCRYEAVVYSANEEFQLNPNVISGLKELAKLRNVKGIRGYEKIIHNKNNISLVDEYYRLRNVESIIDHNLNYRSIDSKMTALRLVKEVSGTLQRVTQDYEFLKNGHGRLKPSNIWIKDDGSFLIGDLGLTQVFVINENKDNMRDTKSVEPIVNRFSLAPEVMNQKDDMYSTKADVWSLGIMLYVLLYRKMPWDGTTSYRFMQNMESFFAATDKVSFVSEQDEVSRAINELLKRMLCVDIFHRATLEEINETATSILSMVIAQILNPDV